MAKTRTKQRQGELVAMKELLSAIETLEKKAFSNAQNMATASLAAPIVSITVNNMFDGVSIMLNTVASLATNLKPHYFTCADSEDWL